MTDLAPAGEGAWLPAARSRFGLPSSGPVLPLAGDVGQRRYFRLRTASGAAVVLVLYPAPSSPAHGEAYREAVLLQRAWKVLGTFEKMLALGREVYRPHRDAAVRTIRRWTRPGSYRPLLDFLPG